MKNSFLFLVIGFFMFNIQLVCADCGSYGCTEAWTTCVNGKCVSTLPTPTPAPAPTQTPYPSDSALIAIQRIYCGDKVCVILVIPPTAPLKQVLPQ